MPAQSFLFLRSRRIRKYNVIAARIIAPTIDEIFATI